MCALTLNRVISGKEYTTAKYPSGNRIDYEARSASSSKNIAIGDLTQLETTPKTTSAIYAYLDWSDELLKDIETAIVSLEVAIDRMEAFKVSIDHYSFE